MIFVLGEHTPFAAGALRRVGSALVGDAQRKVRRKGLARIHRCAQPTYARHTCVTVAARRARLRWRAAFAKMDMRQNKDENKSRFDPIGMRSSHLRAAATGWHNHYTLGG